MAELSTYDEYLIAIKGPLGKLRLSREERDHIAGHALDSIHREADNLSAFTVTGPGDVFDQACSNAARKIAALSNLLGDIGWEREAKPGVVAWLLGELFPVAQLRPWLGEWQRQDDDALVQAEALFKGRGPEDGGRVIDDAQIKLGTGAILLARIEKWMTCKEN